MFPCDYKIQRNLESELAHRNYYKESVRNSRCGNELELVFR